MSAFSLRLFYFILIIMMLFFSGSKMNIVLFNQFDVNINSGNHRTISDVTSGPNLRSSISPGRELKATYILKYKIVIKAYSKMLKNLRHAVCKIKRLLFGSTKSSFEKI
ncbi:hypothetical protein F4826_004941 [Rahnella inusitata]|nr:hypothetical protein [Rahnella inusitata]